MKQDDTGFYQTPNRFLLEHGNLMGPYGIAVYSALLLHDFGNDRCYPSQQRIADLTGCALSTVNRTIAKLVQAGLVKVEHRMNEQGQTSNLYRPALVVGATQPKKAKTATKPVAAPERHTFDTKKGEIPDWDF